MHPWIKQGDYVTVKRIQISDVRLGDIACFLRDNQFVIHRVIKKLPDKTLVTKGDHMFSCDTPLRETQLLGIVILTERGGRYVHKNTKPTWLLNRVMGIIHFVVFSVNIIFRKIKDFLENVAK